MARQWWEVPEWDDDIPPDPPALEVDWAPPEPSVLYGPDGEVLASWTPPVGFARAIPPTPTTAD